MNTERAFTAYHEAGHALACYRLNVPIHRVAVDADGRGGAVFHGQCCTALAELIILSAGWIGEAYLPHCHAAPKTFVPVPAGKTDGERVAVLAPAEADSGTFFLDAFAYRQAAMLIAENLKELEALAILLARRLSVDGEDVEALLAGEGVQKFTPETGIEAVRVTGAMMELAGMAQRDDQTAQPPSMGGERASVRTVGAVA